MSTTQLSEQTRPAWMQDIAQPWGVAVSVDCYDCNPEIIRSADLIKQFTQELIQLIEMKAFGPCHVVNFGEDARVAGYSMFQLIETSCISGHFANQTNTAYLDIFSCKPFSAEVAAEFCKQFFAAKRIRIVENNRW